MSIKNALDDFGSNLVSDARVILKKKDKNASKSLSNSLDYKVKVSKNSFEFTLFAEDYAEYIDKGVHGIGGTKADGTTWKKRKVVNSKFKYKKGIENKPSRKHFDKWVVRRGIAARDDQGRFLSRKSLTSAISHSVWHRGLETTNFLTTPFNKNFKKLPTELVEAYGLNVENLLKSAISNG